MRQTCLDLLELNYGVHIVVDGCSSIGVGDRNVGIQSMRDHGAILTSFQTVVFEVLRDPNHPKFKDILAILKDAPKDTLDLYDH